MPHESEARSKSTHFDPDKNIHIASMDRHISKYGNSDDLSQNLNPTRMVFWLLGAYTLFILKCIFNIF
jgi:hypothetical protein